MQRTGDITERTGIYRSTCCSSEITVQHSETMPLCQKCQKPASWTFIRPSHK